MTDYTKIPITSPNFSNLHQLLDGKWRQIWEIRLNDKHNGDLANIEEQLSNKEVEVVFTQQEDVVYLQMTTTRWQLDDDLIVYTFKMFEVVAAIGVIAQIGTLYNGLERSEKKQLLRQVIERVVVNPKGVVRLELRAPFAYLHHLHQTMEKPSGQGNTPKRKTSRSDASTRYLLRRLDSNQQPIG